MIFSPSTTTCSCDNCSQSFRVFERQKPKFLANNSRAILRKLELEFEKKLLDTDVRLLKFSKGTPPPACTTFLAHLDGCKGLNKCKIFEAVQFSNVRTEEVSIGRNFSYNLVSRSRHKEKLYHPFQWRFVKMNHFLTVWFSGSERKTRILESFPTVVAKSNLVSWDHRNRNSLTSFVRDIVDYRPFRNPHGPQTWF